MTRKQSSKKLKVLLPVGVLMALAGVALGLYGMSGASHEAVIKVPAGSSNASVADSIEAHLGGAYAGRVATMMRVQGVDMSQRQGAWTIAKGESPLMAAHRLGSGAQSGIRFTFNNVRTKQEWVQRAGSLYMAGPKAFEDALNSPELCKKYGKTPETIVCLLLPDTYDFYWNITPEKMLDRMHDYYNEFWSAERRQQAQELGLTPDEVEIIASIAEEETSKADERGKVGRLYINRYKAGQRLQADPTVKYAIGDFGIRRLTREMLMTPSPYNTYRNNGLPPGPIRLPEKGTIDAILTSQPHPYMFMCAKSDFSGYHDFTVTYQDHLANAHRYQQALDQRGIK